MKQSIGRRTVLDQIKLLSALAKRARRPSPLAGEGVGRRPTDEGRPRTEYDVWLRKQGYRILRLPDRSAPSRLASLDSPHPTGCAGHLLPQGERGARLQPILIVERR
jgi:hypothetical protein